MLGCQVSSIMSKKPNTITTPRLFAIGVIFVAVSISWIALGTKLSIRNEDSTARAKSSVNGLWGPQQNQAHPRIWHTAFPNSPNRSYVQPVSSNVDIILHYEPKKKGLSWNSTYTSDFSAIYQIQNTSKSERIFHIHFSLPSESHSYYDFIFQIGDDVRKDIMPSSGAIQQKVSVSGEEIVSLKVSYRSRGMDRWSYHLGNVERISNFKLNMQANFENIDFPEGSSSPTSREYDQSADTWQLTWSYPDVIRPQRIAMQMPKIKDAGLIASKVSFFAPVSLLFFFSVIIIFSLIKGISLHPMNYVFLAAGFFSFHLLFAYLADLVPLHLAFLIASATSLALIGSYVQAVGGKSLIKIAAPAQFAYLVLFSYSFLFDGVTGLTIAVGSIITLALVMRATAKVDWTQVFTADLIRQKTPKNGHSLAEAQPPS